MEQTYVLTEDEKRLLNLCRELGTDEAETRLRSSYNEIVECSRYGSYAGEPFTHYEIKRKEAVFKDILEANEKAFAKIAKMAEHIDSLYKRIYTMTICEWFKNRFLKP